ncbi:MAG: selenide, water dikinase SelD, partial [Pseudomonadota bacterium]
ARWLDEIFSAASDVFSSEGAAIVGGHSSLGAEFALGFTITGLEAPGTRAERSPAAGDALILTRPLGSGTLFAALMAGQASGDDIQAMLATLTLSQGPAAKAVHARAAAMTDVTGFGLAGHADRMLRDTKLAADFELSALRLFPGAEALAADGLRSTLWQGNRDSVAFNGPETPRTALLFDPQTAGGFLAVVPPEHVDALLGELQDMGHDAARIGTLVERGDHTVVAH